MKKLTSTLLGLALATGTFAFAQDKKMDSTKTTDTTTMGDKKTKTKKAKKAKKGADAATTPAPTK